MRVHYDDQIFVTHRQSGVARYFVELIRQFSMNLEYEVDVERGWHWTLNEAAIAAHLGGPLPIPGGAKGRVLRAANLVSNLLRPIRADLFHPTYYEASGLARSRARPMAVTVHDMTPELFPQLFPAGNPHAFKQEYVRRASIVLCVSENTRQDLLRLYGPIASPVVVTHLGVDERFRPAPAPRPSIGRFLLHVGRRGGYKDFAVALEAFAQLRPSQRSLSLLALGGGRFTGDEQALIQRWGLSGSVTQRDVPESELPKLYGEASILVYPSRYEGFGLPALEAMACGTPVVLADASSLPEVGGTAALYFPPGDPAALAEQLRRLLEDPVLMSELSATGLNRAQEMTWLKTAKATALAYRLALG